VKNNQLFAKGIRLNSLLRDIFHIVACTSNILQNNKRYSAAGISLDNIVSELREADYIVNNMNQIKRDILLQGENAEYVRTFKGLTLRWQFWMVKWKTSLYICKNATIFNNVFLV
jgi:hypothetical protein